MPRIIPSGWGFSRYGADRYFALADVEGWTSDSAAASIAAISEYVTTEITSASDAVDIADSVGEIFELLNTVERTQSGTVEYISYERFSEILRERYGEKYDKAYERAEEDHALIESYGVLSDISSLAGFDSDGIMTALIVLRLHGVSVISLRSLLMPIVSSIDVSSIMNGHYTEVYSAYMSRDADECFDSGDGYEIVRLSVLGDADITVSVGDETVSQISDGETVRSDVPTWSRAGITNIYLPSSDGTQYSVSITSESGKTLAYTVSEISYSLTTQNRAIYTGLSLGEGECASLSFSSASEFGDSKYNATVISDGDIRVYSASAVTDKSADTLTLELISDGEGETSGGGRYEIGDFVTVSARAMSGSRFIGWYLGESCVSDDKVYTFCMTESCSITARFSRNERVAAPTDGDSYADEDTRVPVELIISTSVTVALLGAAAVIVILKYKRKTKKETPVS